jgi:DNA-directed RNA polymerase specialized sigma24 family protein
MSWSTLPPPFRTIAERELTARQLEALVLWEDGLGYTRIAAKLGISVSAARDRIHRALRNIETALEKAA